METISTGYWKLSSRAATLTATQSNNDQDNRFSQHEQETPDVRIQSARFQTRRHSHVAARAFHFDKISAMMPMYDPKPVLITSDGRTTTTEIAARPECDLKYALPLKACARHVYVAVDFALIVLDRSIDGKGLSRKYVRGSASGVVRRADRWQYLIDNNQRTAVAALSDGATRQLGTNITAT